LESEGKLVTYSELDSRPEWAEDELGIPFYFERTELLWFAAHFGYESPEEALEKLEESFIGRQEDKSELGRHIAENMISILDFEKAVKKAIGNLSTYVSIDYEQIVTDLDLNGEIANVSELDEAPFWVWTNH
jgi:hypothetical protein